jgi:CheY-like chemotaxis protein
MRDPLAALAWIEDGANRADLLLTDLTMPHLNGLQLAGQVARLRPGLPVLLASGNLDAVGDGELAAAGLRAVLAKPVDPAALRQALSAALAAASPGAA